MLDNQSLLKLGLESISESAPCGENARYESAFEQLEAELAKQESLTAATVDWGKVIDLSAEILLNTSKDLLVAAYLCYGLLIKEGYQGLVVGLKVLNDMVEAHWDGLFPPVKRMRARQTAFVWLAEKAAIIVAEKIPAADELDTVIQAEKMLRQLNSLLVDKMADQAPLLSDLSRPLKGYKQSAEAELAKAEAPKSEPQVASVNEQSAPAASNSEPVTAPSPSSVAPEKPPPVAAKPASKVATAELSTGTLESENDCKKSFRQIQSAVRDVSTFFISQKLTDPRGYRLTRVAVWLSVDNAPPANDGVTQVVPPAAERLKFLSAKLEKAEHAELIPELEKTISRAPFWLDGHFMVVKCLRALGAQYEKAAQTVIRETACFLSRLPELVELSFADQTPFASDQTRLWLTAEVLQSGTHDASSQAEAADAAEAWSIALTDASRLAASGDSDKAIALINDGLRQAGCMREQIYWRSTLAQLLLQIGQANAAASLLEQVINQLDEPQVSTWEPAMMALIYNLLFQSYQKQQVKKKDDAVLKEKTAATFRKLCWFDPITALSVKGG